MTKNIVTIKNATREEVEQFIEMFNKMKDGQVMATTRDIQLLEFDSSLIAKANKNDMTIKLVPKFDACKECKVGVPVQNLSKEGYCENCKEEF